ncbi:MAG: hypothetical protein WDM89_05430 [Rhizomicrobium sp.]
MHKRKSIDSRLSSAKRLFHGRVAGLCRLQAQQAHHDLKVILNAMMRFADLMGLVRHSLSQTLIPVLNASAIFSIALPSNLNSAGAFSSWGLSR